MRLAEDRWKPQWEEEWEITEMSTHEQMVFRGDTTEPGEIEEREEREEAEDQGVVFHDDIELRNDY